MPELSFKGDRFIYRRADKPEYLIVIFACAGDDYNRLKHYPHSHPTVSFLFLCSRRYNKDRDWYKGYNDYGELLEPFLQEYDPKNVIFMGSSFGAMASLTFGFLYEIGAILITAPYHLEEDLSYIKRIEINMHLCRSLPALYIEASGKSEDHRILQILTNHYVEFGGRMIFESVPNEDRHWIFSLAHKVFTDRTIGYLMNWQGKEFPDV